MFLASKPKSSSLVKLRAVETFQNCVVGKLFESGLAKSATQTSLHHTIIHVVKHSLLLGIDIPHADMTNVPL